MAWQFVCSSQMYLELNNQVFHIPTVLTCYEPGRRASFQHYCILQGHLLAHNKMFQLGWEPQHHRWPTAKRIQLCQQVMLMLCQKSNMPAWQSLRKKNVGIHLTLKSPWNPMRIQLRALGPCQDLHLSAKEAEWSETDSALSLTHNHSLRE